MGKESVQLDTPFASFKDAPGTNLNLLSCVKNSKNSDRE